MEKEKNKENKPLENGVKLTIDEFVERIIQEEYVKYKLLAETYKTKSKVIGWFNLEDFSKCFEKRPTKKALLGIFKKFNVFGFLMVEERSSRLWYKFTVTEAEQKNTLKAVIKDSKDLITSYTNEINKIQQAIINFSIDEKVCTKILAEKFNTDKKDDAI
jgi:hypothetical protein